MCHLVKVYLAAVAWFRRCAKGKRAKIIKRRPLQMKVLVINAGSSSLKYQLIDMTDESVLAKGSCERIGIDGDVYKRQL